MKSDDDGANFRVVGPIWNIPGIAIVAIVTEEGREALASSLIVRLRAHSKKATLSALKASFRTGNKTAWIEAGNILESISPSQEQGLLNPKKTKVAQI
ncbi:hypothetical protein BDFG_04533 [Blastomyces dermatitidis ATCC 26199]|nr:hypothetical protein BDFG_04533 [Blastomyces dermatitidis ATCC 26199]